MEVSKLRANSVKAKGFSFIEVLAAVTIFSFVVVGVMLMTTMHIRTSSYAQHHTKAMQLAEDGMEMLKRLNYDAELINMDGVVNDFGTIANYPEFRRDFQVNWNTEISTLRVTVTWRSMARNPNPVVLVSLRTSQ